MFVTFLDINHEIYIFLFYFRIQSIFEPKPITSTVYLGCYPVKQENLKTYLGNVQRDLKLNFEKDTEVYWSCGASLNGQYWIIGGHHEKRQVSHF